MSLEDRLLLAAGEVSAGCHGDVGTDHAQLPLYLLSHRLCEKVIATEKSESAYLVAKQALWGRRDAEVRLGDGLTPFGEGELQSVSLCGMGGSLVEEILLADPGKVPDIVITQANRDNFKIRRWARDAGFHLVKEQMAQGHWVYEILTFHRAKGEDPAYDGISEELALFYGPRLLKARHPLLISDLKRRLGYLPEHPRNEELRRVKEALKIVR